MVMDVRTGEVLAMVSAADFDPNQRVTKNLEDMFNRNTSGVYEMGTTIKVLRITAAYGYGFAISPLQLLSSISGVLREDGAMPQPTLLVENIGSKPAQPLVSPGTAKHMRALMLRVTEETYGRKARVPGIVIYSKTGTANKRRASGRGYQKKDVSTSFVGIFPESPRYAVFVMLDCPKGIKKTFGYNAGGWNAAPITGRIINRIVTTLGIEPDHVVEDKGGPLLRLTSGKMG